MNINAYRYVRQEVRAVLPMGKGHKVWVLLLHEQMVTRQGWKARHRLRPAQRSEEHGMLGAGSATGEATELDRLVARLSRLL